MSTDSPAAGSRSPLSRVVDYRVYLVTSGTDQHTVDTAAAVARGGAGIIQVRAKDLSAQQYTELVCAVADAVAKVNEGRGADETRCGTYINDAYAGETKVVVDDRADVALAARLRGSVVHGVHLGQDDLDPVAARQMLGEDAIIGLTTGTLELVEQAQEYHQQHPGVLDYLGAGPFRPTPTKKSGRTPLGVDGYPPLVAATELPIVAIGDVTPDDVADLSATGIAGCAMVRSLMNADDPTAEAARALAAWMS